MRLIFSFLALIITSGAWGASFTIAPPSSWVDPITLPDTTTLKAADPAYGYDYLLINHQVNVAESETFDQNAYRLTSASALGSGARITWSFDPTYETLTLHHLRVIRDGVVQERLREGVVQIIQQERDLDRHMLNGRLTAFVLLEDVRVGDVIDYASSRRGANPVFGGKYMEDLSTGWSVPVRHQRIRIIVPSDRPLTHKQLGDSVLIPSSIRSGNDTILTWEGRDLPVIQGEGELPSWYTPYPSLQLTEFKSWAEVASWAVPLYALPDVVPESVATKAAELTEGLSTAEDKTIALLNFVQQEIRYLGLELGPGTHRPTAPADVLARRFGDCKDKTLLFCTLMRASGLKAWPALVNTDYRDHIKDWVPSPYAFDHVIACVSRGQALWWVDPTLTNQKGGALYRGLPDYRLSLPVDRNTDALAPITRPELAQRRMEIDERFDVTAFDAPARFKVVSRYTGLSADSIRAYFARTSLDEITKEYVNYYATAYPGLTSTKPVSISDRAETNTVTIEENYSVPDLWKSEDSEPNILKANFYPQIISDYATQPSTRVRTMPLGISYPVNVLLTTRIHLHKDWEVPLTESTVTDHAFRLTDKMVGTGRLVTINYRWESLADNVPADKIASHVSAISRVRGTLGYNLTHNKAIAAANANTAGTSDVVPRFRFNWMPIVLILVTSVVMFYVGRHFYALPALMPPPVPAPDETNLVGLGGWLIVVALGVIGRPIFCIVQLIREFGAVFNLDTWEAITTPGSATYQAAFGPIIITEVIGNTLLITGGLWLAVFFFKRKRAFPGAFIALMVFILLFLSVDTWAVDTLLKSDEPEKTKTISEITKVVIQCAIWIPYMLKSRRVKLTFTR
ncbi:DUF3857 domain-containing protein [Rariglobus hedericola]|uniref:DUF2569 family protein n=1 Tax=Rariglobus hedericola TaxID=2597822 RepID=A0A556QQ36_9BACT|nr:DUF3857 domain-containing protein [Rariglobus hedericola]TSJ78729.1 DUF2569 family protein [Rariglobus hedericola]